MFQKSFFNGLLVCFIYLTVCLHAGEDSPRKILSKAIQSGDLVTVQSLIESSAVGVDELSEGYDSKSPLIEAACYTQISIIEYLIKKGACIEGASERGYSPLVKFIEAGSRVSFQQLLDTVGLFLTSGADVNGAGKDGYTALMAACQHTKCVELVQLLLDFGAFIDAQAKNEDTAYLLSLRYNNVNAYRLLLNRGANTKMTWDGMQALSVLASEGNVTMARILIEDTGANVNVYDSIGATPLIRAVVSKSTSMAQLLIENGANINAITKSALEIIIPQKTLYISLDKTVVVFPAGCTALNFARTMRDSAMDKFITNLGGIIYQEVEYKEVIRYHRFLPYLW